MYLRSGKRLTMAEATTERGEFKAEGSLEFVVSLEEQPFLNLAGKERWRDAKWSKRMECGFCYNKLRKSFFNFDIAIEARDAIYPFQIELYRDINIDYYDDIYFFMDVCPAEDDSAFWLEQKIEFNGKVWEKKGCSSDFAGRNGEGDPFEYEGEYMFQINEYHDGAFKFPSKCKIKIDMKIYSLKDKEEEEAQTLRQFLKSDEANFKVICPTEDGNKEYYVNESLIAKESDVLEALMSGRWVEGQSKEMAMNDTDCGTLESVLTFCKTKALPMSAIDENLAIFADKYNLENLMDLMDKVLSMSLSIIEDKGWIIKWTPKLKMTRTALKLLKFLRREAKSTGTTFQGRKEFASCVYNGTPNLTWSVACKGNRELANYLGCFTEIKESFPKYSDLTYSKNVMIMLEQESEWPDDESVKSTVRLNEPYWSEDENDSNQGYENFFDFFSGLNSGSDRSENDDDESLATEPEDNNEVSDNNNTMSDSNNNTMSDNDIE